MTHHDCLMCGEGETDRQRGPTRVFCHSCWRTFLKVRHSQHTCRKDALQAMFERHWAMWERSGAATLWRNKVLSEYGSTDTEKAAA